jgi:hypothetical protein
MEVDSVMEVDFTDFTEEEFAAAVSGFTRRTGIPSVMAITMMTR